MFALGIDSGKRLGKVEKLEKQRTNVCLLLAIILHKELKSRPEFGFAMVCCLTVGINRW